MEHFQWLLAPIAFIVQSIICVYFAWGGSNAALIMLAVTSVVVSVLCAFYALMWKQSLDGWGDAQERWAAAQNWGIASHNITQDVLQELSEYDDEAVAIHGGRAHDANREYWNVLHKEGK